MILPDENVLIYAFRRDLPQHDWVPSFGSHRTPSTIEEAFEFCEKLLGQPHCQIVEPGERHWDIFKQLCIEAETREFRVTDAWFAALAIEWGCEWITLDRDYARFLELKWQVPTPPLLELKWQVPTPPHD